MTSPSPANSKDAGVQVRPVVEPGAIGPGATHAVVKGEVAPRLPHERDESSDSGTGEPTDIMRKAGRDAERGHTDAPRGPATQQRYSELTEAAQPEAQTLGRRSVPPG